MDDCYFKDRGWETKLMSYALMILFVSSLLSYQIAAIYALNSLSRHSLYSIPLLDANGP